ncbi:MAG: 3-deoxy-8-phosphooctulonate synthase [Legionellales bacterium]|nr:3-deoxy-8-phosphooctulonate synthase [Legionellales bacterium]|tara:strand:- start:395 stop:1213 length:819 start_codon:yes stop_codon:yes gene_type:complete
MTINPDSFFLVAGPCVIESEALLMNIAETMVDITSSLGIDYYFKASYDKANRTSINGFRGPGIDRGLELLSAVKREFGVKILTDVHQESDIACVAEVADVIQIPAFLCRQTSLIEAAAKTDCVVNIKKGQFLSPEDMQYAVSKVKPHSKQACWVTERGSCFGYRNLVVDMRSLAIMKATTGSQVVFDATHSVQQPGANAGSTGGQREYVPLLARSAVAAGVDGLFFETHPTPEHAKSDAANTLPLSMMRSLLAQLNELHQMIQRQALVTGEV